jgi:integrase
LHEQYGDLDSDYVFVNFTGPAIGSAWRYSSVDDLVGRLRRRSGVHFTPHAFRHTYATELLRRGVPVEIVQALLGHSSVTTTSETYAHIKVEDSRAALDRVGWFHQRESGP